MTEDTPPPSGWPIARLLPALLLSLIFVAMAPVIGIAWYAADSNQADAARDRRQLMLDLIARRLQTHLEPVRAQLAYLSQAIEGGEIDFDNPDQWRSFALGALAAAPQAVGYLVFPVEGQPTLFTRADRSVRPEPRENVPQAADVMARARGMSGPGWVEPVWSDVVGEPILPIVVPIRVRGEFRGFIAAAIGTSDLSRFLKELDISGERKPFILVGRESVLAHPHLGEQAGSAEQHDRRRLSTLGEVNDPVLASIWAPDANPLPGFVGARSVAGHWNWVGDRSFAWHYRPIDDYAPARLIIGYHEAGRESARARWIVRGILIAGGLLMVLTGAAAILLGRRLANPILALADAARSVERLELDRVPALANSRVREVNLANRAFERMARGLRLSATYLPRALVARLTARQGGLPASEDRSLTVMFCDLEGYTSYSRGRPAAEAAAYLNDLLARVGPAIEACGGTIDKYMGDGLMAFWGAPEPTTDHARAACLGALAVAAEVDAFNRERRARGGVACRMRIGLHTGTVMVGNVGFAGRIDYTAVGEAVNVAARLEQFGKVAPRSADVTIVVSAACSAASGDEFRRAPLDGKPADIPSEGVMPLTLLLGRLM
ncbi:MAG: adenylate/guanylate cyclase domain-containing protein [Alphaproteobacteria bacterium]|nr:adenylate/guanylate cyclase domain-containing protein [Alphaproteobacteria bacterium]MCW5739170.1 adenylate/guanylate cyclase domain-containing protein [Alphaproteobacteria bacterium]